MTSPGVAAEASVVLVTSGSQRSRYARSAAWHASTDAPVYFNGSDQVSRRLPEGESFPWTTSVWLAQAVAQSPAAAACASLAVDQVHEKLAGGTSVWSLQCVNYSHS